MIALTNLTPPQSLLSAGDGRCSVGWVSPRTASSLGVVTSLPVYLAPLAAWATFVVAVTAAMTAVTMRRRRAITVWRAWSGAAGAVCLTEWNPRRLRHEAHSWAAFPRHRHLGRRVAVAAVGRGPRPLWMEPALPGMREMYRDEFGFVDSPGSRWMVLN